MAKKKIYVPELPGFDDLNWEKLKEATPELMLKTLYSIAYSIGFVRGNRPEAWSHDTPICSDTYAKANLPGVMQKLMDMIQPVERTEKMHLKFNAPDAWGYPAGLGEKITAILGQEGIRIAAANESGSTIYVEVPKLGMWSICDNGGELNLNKVNTLRDRQVPLTSTLGMPANVNDYAFTVAAWILAAFRNKPIDYTWRCTAYGCQRCGKDDLPLHSQTRLCVRCVIDSEGDN